jgi:hypothetical protein
MTCAVHIKFKTTGGMQMRQWSKAHVGMACVMVLAGTLASLGDSLPAAASTPPAPPKTFSFHVGQTTNTASWYKLGEDYGAELQLGDFAKYSDVALDFGVPANSGGYGTILDTGCGCFSSDSADAAVTEQFALGFIQGAGPVSASWAVFMVVDNTSTSFFNNSANAHAAGVNWGNTYDNVATWINQHEGGSYTVMEPGAGINAETEAGNATYTPTQNFYLGWYVNGYAIPYGVGFADFGDAGGCPTSGGTGSCDNSWTAGEVFNLAGGDAGNFAYIQVYNTLNAQQWGNINNTWPGLLTVYGINVQHTACLDEGNPCTGNDFTVDQAFTAIYNALNCPTCKSPQTPASTTDFRYDPEI